MLGEFVCNYAQGSLSVIFHGILHKFRRFLCRQEFQVIGLIIPLQHLVSKPLLESDNGERKQIGMTCGRNTKLGADDVMALKCTLRFPNMASLAFLPLADEYRANTLVFSCTMVRRDKIHKDRICQHFVSNGSIDVVWTILSTFLPLIHPFMWVRMTSPPLHHQFLICCSVFSGNFFQLSTDRMTSAPSAPSPPSAGCSQGVAQSAGRGRERWAQEDPSFAIAFFGPCPLFPLGLGKGRATFFVAYGWVGTMVGVLAADAYLWPIFSLCPTCSHNLALFSVEEGDILASKLGKWPQETWAHGFRIFIHSGVLVASWLQALSGKTPCLYFEQDAVVRICVARKERFFKLNRLQMKSVFEGWAWCQVSEGCQTTIEGRQDF